MKYILAWLIATSLMTVFSYLFYYITQKEAREPYLLSYIIITKFPEFPRLKSIGWILHYVLGIGFLLLNIFLIMALEVDDSILWGFPFGVIAGILGIIGWNIIFKVADQLPKINFTVYFMQLVVAHIVFCVSAIAVYSYMG